MRTMSKPVWSEGMYLGPHHFQTQNRFFEETLNFVVSSLWRDACGFVGIQFDADALRNGTLTLTHARGIFPDGLAFDFPDSDAAPPPREFAALFSPVADHLTFHLAIPAVMSDGQNTSLSGKANSTRYLGSEQKLPDLNTGLDERLITLGRKNLQLLTESEISDRYVHMPVVRIVRDGTGRFESDSTMIPPCLSLRASPGLTEILHRLMDILEEKSAVITVAEGQRSGVFQTGMSERHVAQYWFLHTLNTSLPVLHHFMVSQRAHPQELFREMSRLAGALCTFGLEVHPRSLPSYDHMNLGDCFHSLDDHIRRHLDIIIQPAPIRIALQSIETYLYHGVVTDERCLGPSRWILEIEARIGDADLIANAPKLVKICSAQFIRKLIERAVPGLSLRHISTPPTTIGTRVESQYFSIERTGPCWEHIVKTREVGIYIPAEIPAPTVSIIVLLEENGPGGNGPFTASPKR